MGYSASSLLTRVRVMKHRMSFETMRMYFTQSVAGSMSLCGCSDDIALQRYCREMIDLRSSANILKDAHTINGDPCVGGRVVPLFSGTTARAKTLDTSVSPSPQHTTPPAGRSHVFIVDPLSRITSCTIASGWHHPTKLPTTTIRRHSRLHLVLRNSRTAPSRHLQRQPSERAARQ
jgi:hypothetical protein